MKCVDCGATVRVIEYESDDDKYVVIWDAGAFLQRWPDGHWCFQCDDCSRWEWREATVASEPILPWDESEG